MDLPLPLSLGIGIAAATGFRVFVPPLVVGLASTTGYVDLPESAAWLAHPMVITAFAVAAFVEILAYMIPWVDHALDVIAGPLAVVAGTILTWSFLGDVSPALRWSLALIAGGGAAASTQFATTVARTASTATTGGVANPFVSFVEGVISTITTIVALVFPVVVAVLVVVLVGWGVRRRVRRVRTTVSVEG